MQLYGPKLQLGPKGNYNGFTLEYLTDTSVKTLAIVGKPLMIASVFVTCCPHTHSFNERT